MKRKITAVLLVVLGVMQFTTVGYGAKESEPVTDERLYEDLYIGEVFKSGFLYIEPFGIDRDTVGKTSDFSGYPKRIKFYSCKKDNRVRFFDASFDSVFKTYVPDREEGSNYFLQPFSQPEQCGLRYKTDFLPPKTELGIALFNLDISEIEYRSGVKRSYSDVEYARAQNQVKKDHEIEESDRTLRFMNIEDTIVGAKQILIIHFNDAELTMRLSQYFTLNFENTATVYVVDILKNGNVIKTYEKHNWDGPY